MRLMAEAHVLIFPFPALGHVHPMLKIAELISNAGVNVTFLNTEHIHSRLLDTSSELLTRLSGYRRTFRFRTISDGLQEDHPRSVARYLELVKSMRTRSEDCYRKLLTSDGDGGHGWPRVSCVIAGGILPLAIEVPEEMGIPVMIFRTSSACNAWAFFSITKLIERGELPFPEDADMDKLIEGVEGMESFMRRRDLPGFLRNANSSADPNLQFLISISNNTSRATAFILNTVERLEASALSYIRSICPITYTVGPLQLPHASSVQSSLATCGLWREDRSCISWLDAQPPKSVVYVSFGSTATMSQDMFLELWNGLVDADHRFLLVIRRGMVQGVAAAHEVIERTIKKSFTVEWAPQEEVLAHPAVGCFLTHCGWNSTLESIAAGVPMICWPFFADQYINSRFVSEVWKIGIDMKDTRDRSIVEKTVRKMMDGEEGEMLRSTVKETAEMVKVSIEEGGSSYMNFHRLIRHIKSLSSSSCIATRGIQSLP